MKFKKGQSGNPKGRKKGAKTKASESFYADCLALYNEKGIDGLRAFVNKCPHNTEVFYGWMAKWAEKQIKQSLEVAGENGGPINAKLVIEIVDPEKK